MTPSHLPTTHAAPAVPDREQLAAAARRVTADLALLRAAVEARSGADNAQLLHDHAAEAFRRLLAGAGAYTTAAEVRGG